MKKVFASFLILFLMITNCGYAMQQEHFTNIDSYQKDSIFNEEKNNGSKKIKISEPSITKEKSEKKQSVERIIINGSNITADTSADRINKDISVTDNVYKETSVSPLSISASYTDLSITSLTVKPGITYPFKVGETAFLQYKIANYGNTTAYNTTTQVKFNGTLVGTINVGNILGGNEHTLEISLNGVPEGCKR